MFARRMDPPYVDILLREDNYKEDFPKVLEVIRPSWNPEEVIYDHSERGIARGLVNTMVRCYHKDNSTDSIMIRIHNVSGNANEWFSRDLEAKGIKYFHQANCGPNIYATFKNGFCYEFYHGEVLNVKRLREDDIWRCVAVELAKLHSTNITDTAFDTTKPMFYVFLDKCWVNYPTELKDPERNKIFQEGFPAKEVLEKEITEVFDHALSFDPELAVCHNDLKAENMIWNNETKTVKLVDFEAIGRNYKAYDIAHFFDRFTGVSPINFENLPDETFQKNWIRVYLETVAELNGKPKDSVTSVEINKLYGDVQRFYLVCCLVLALSGPLMEASGMLQSGTLDCLQFGLDALKKYHLKKAEAMALH